MAVLDVKTLFENKFAIMQAVVLLFSMLIAIFLRLPSFADYENDNDETVSFVMSLIASVAALGMMYMEVTEKNKTRGQAGAIVLMYVLLLVAHVTITVYGATSNENKTIAGLSGASIGLLTLLALLAVNKRFKFIGGSSK